MNGRLALIKSQLLLSNYVSCLLAALSWLSAEWDISGSLPGIRAIPLHWAWTQFSIMGISESSWGSREVTLEFSWVNPADGVLFQSGDSEPKAGGDHGGVGFMEDPQTPYRHHINPYEKMFIIHAQSLPQPDRTVPPGGHIEQRISSLAHMFKFLFHMFNFHSVYLFHIALTFFFTYTLFYIFSFY